jgi:hypothetical protein
LQLQGSFSKQKGLSLKRGFMSLSAAAIGLAFAASVAAAPAAPTNTHKTTASTSKTPKISKWQQHVLEELKDSAPGDEYFGRMKMSYLGINNTFHDQAIRAGEYTTDPHLISAVAWADEALNAWAKKYPNDPQLARSYFLAFMMYRKIYTPQYQQKAWDYAHIVIKKWPASFFGKTLKKDISIGYTEHYFATPVPCSSLTTASPTPDPTPPPRPGQPKLDVLPVPCVAAANETPQTMSSPSPSASPSPHPSTP